MPTPDKAHSNAKEQLKAVKALWNSAPAGSKRDQAHTHYQAAEAAHEKNEDSQCISELGKARAALK